MEKQEEDLEREPDLVSIASLDVIHRKTEGKIADKYRSESLVVSQRQTTMKGRT